MIKVTKTELIEALRAIPRGQPVFVDARREIRQVPSDSEWEQWEPGDAWFTICLPRAKPAKAKGKKG